MTKQRKPREPYERVEITVKTLGRLDKNLPKFPNRRLIMDTISPLVIRSTPSGQHTYCIYRRIGGKPTQRTIGRVGSVELKEARRLAGELAQAVMRGED